MRETIAIAASAVPVAVLLRSCARGGETADEASSAPSTVKNVVDEVPEDFRSKRVHISDELYHAAAESYASCTAYQPTGVLTDWKPFLDAALGSELTVEREEKSEWGESISYACSEGGSATQSVSVSENGKMVSRNVYYTCPTADYYTCLITPADYETLGAHSYTTDYFEINADLHGFPCAEAKQRVMDDLAAAGLYTDADHITAYALTRENLQEVADLRKAAGGFDAKYGDNGVVIAPDSYELYKQFTQEDECYYMQVRPVLEGGIPLDCDAELTLYLSATGYLQILGRFPVVCTELGAPVEIINADQALSLLCKEYASDFGPEVEIYSMELAYHITMSEGNACLTPYWIFLVLEQPASGDGRGMAYSFNAISGEKIDSRSPS